MFRCLFAKFLSNSESSTGEEFCKRELPIDHPSDIFVCFVSIFIRVNLNLCYNYFLKKQVSISTEKYFLRRIEEFVRDLANEIWELNVNYFFIIYRDFLKLNHSNCFYFPNVNSINELFNKVPKNNYYFSRLPVVSSSSTNSNSDNSDSDSYFIQTCIKHLLKNWNRMWIKNTQIIVQNFILTEKIDLFMSVWIKLYLVLKIIDFFLWECEWSTKEELKGAKFEFFRIPNLISCTKWKFDYIIARRETTS